MLVEALKMTKKSFNTFHFSLVHLCKIAAKTLQTKPIDMYIIGAYRPNYNLKEA